MKPVADTLTVVMVDTQRNRVAIIHEGQSMPYSKRTVHIKLTEEQLKQLQPLCVGKEKGKDVFEELGDVWIETRGDEDE